MLSVYGLGRIVDDDVAERRQIGAVLIAVEHIERIEVVGHGLDADGRRVMPAQQAGNEKCVIGFARFLVDALEVKQFGHRRFPIERGIGRLDAGQKCLDRLVRPDRVRNGRLRQQSDGNHGACQRPCPCHGRTSKFMIAG